MKKLTLVSIMCRNKLIRTFCYLPVVNGKTILSSKAIDDLFEHYCGFIPERGETISYGL